MLELGGAAEKKGVGGPSELFEEPSAKHPFDLLATSMCFSSPSPMPRKAEVQFQRIQVQYSIRGGTANA